MLALKRAQFVQQADVQTEAKPVIIDKKATIVNIASIVIVPSRFKLGIWGCHC